MIGVVLAGGRSERFGGAPKGLQLLHGLPLVVHVVKVLRLVTSRCVIEALPSVGYEGVGIECIYARAEFEGRGPLAGMLSGLEIAGASDLVAFAPCDMPLLSPFVYERLLKNSGGAYAISPNGVEPLVCVLPASAHGVVLSALSRSVVLPVQGVFEEIGAIGIQFDEGDWFKNVNTPEELARIQV